METKAKDKDKSKHLSVTLTEVCEMILWITKLQANHDFAAGKDENLSVQDVGGGVGGTVSADEGRDSREEQRRNRQKGI